MKNIPHEPIAIAETSEELSGNIDRLLPTTQKDIESNQKKREKLVDYSRDFKGKLKEYNRQAKFFTDNEHCPTCDQNVEEEHRKEKIATAESKASTVSEPLKDVDAKIKDQDATLEVLKEQIDIVMEWQKELVGFSAESATLHKNISALQKEIANLKEGDGDLHANEELQNFRDGKEKLPRREVPSQH